MFVLGPCHCTLAYSRNQDWGGGWGSVRLSLTLFRSMAPRGRSQAKVLANIGSRHGPWMVFVGTGCVGKPKKAMPRRDGSWKGGSSGDSGFKKEASKHMEGRRLGYMLSLGAKGIMHWGEEEFALQGQRLWFIGGNNLLDRIEAGRTNGRRNLICGKNLIFLPFCW